jgi:hypothetical protein
LIQHSDRGASSAHAAPSLLARTPLRLRLLERVLAPFASWVDLGPDAVRRRAERLTGLGDWGDDDSFDERLGAACKAVDGPGLSAVGRVGAATYYHIHAANRLRVVEAVKRRPEVHDVPIEAPIVIVGLYRTGTTSLHGLLAADPRHRAPRAWELMSPAPRYANAAIDRRVRRLRSGTVFALDHFLVPEQSQAHAIPLDGAEECFFLLENDFVSSTTYNSFGGWDYAFDLIGRDLRPTYRFLKLQLQLMALDAPRRRWILKSPFHLWHLDALMSVFPDARIVFTHRTIAEALPSNCSLSAMTTSKFVRHLDLEALGDFWRRFYRAGMDRVSESRGRIPADQQFDLPLARIAQDPESAVEDLYAHFHIDPAPGRAAIGAEVARTRSGGGGHRYGLAQFGLSASKLLDEFSDYEAFLASVERPLRCTG